MEITLYRIAIKDTYTIGKLSIDGKYFCDTLEDKVRRNVKIKDKTAIQRGRYKIEWTLSKRFKKYLPILLNVPNFEGIRIHSGNTDEDTSGCILVGKNTEVGKVTNSRFYSNSLNIIIKTAIVAGLEVWITITE